MRGAIGAKRTRRITGSVVDHAPGFLTKGYKRLTKDAKNTEAPVNVPVEQQNTVAPEVETEVEVETEPTAEETTDDTATEAE